MRGTITTHTGPSTATAHHHEAFDFTLWDHLFILRALILRDLRLRHQNFGRLGFLNDFIQPLVVILLHYYVFVFMNRHMPARIPVELYCLGGFTTWFVFRDTSVKYVLGIEEGKDFVLIPGVTFTHALVAAAIWEMVACIVILYVGLGVSVWLFGSEPLPNISLSMLAFCVSALLGTGFKLFFDPLGVLWPVMKGIKGSITFLLFLTSGIYFGSTGAGKSDILDKFVSYNPLFHVLEPQRQALWPGYPVVGISILYAVIWALGLMFVGLLLRRWVSARAKHR